MKTYHEETLAALFDGEAADPEALADALAQPDAKGFLVELARLRLLTQDDDRRPDDRFYVEMKRVFRPHRWQELLGRALPLPAAAAGVILVVTGTVAVLLLAPASPLPVPPPPSALGRGMVTEAPPADSGAQEAGAHRPARHPPVAHRVMRFVGGRDWRQEL